MWSGTSALTIGLIDEMGGLNDAISGAAKLAGLDVLFCTENSLNWKILTQELLSQLSGEVKMNVLKNELGESVKLFNIIREVKDMTGIQARLPYFIDIH